MGVFLLFWGFLFGLFCVSVCFFLFVFLLVGCWVFCLFVCFVLFGWFVVFLFVLVLTWFLCLVSGAVFFFVVFLLFFLFFVLFVFLFFFFVFVWVFFSFIVLFFFFYCFCCFFFFCVCLLVLWSFVCSVLVSLLYVVVLSSHCPSFPSCFPLIFGFFLARQGKLMGPNECRRRSPLRPCRAHSPIRLPPWLPGLLASLAPKLIN